MPLLTTVIDDKSPLITYDATWLAGTSQDDSYAVDYYLGTFQKNSAPAGTATFNFNGSAFWIYGANRPNHGRYTVQVDGKTYPSINGSGNNLFQQTLFTTTVTQGMHSVNLINTDGQSSLYLDIDMIAWQSEVGNASDELVPELVQDTDSRFQYQQAAWGTTSPTTNINMNLLNNGTGHITATYDATVVFTFIAVTVFGTSGPSNGPYSAQLDGGQATTYNASNAYPTNYGVTIYHADNLGPGTHQLALTNLPAASGDSLSIDYAQLWTVANSSSSASNNSCIPSTVPGVLPSSSIASNGISSGAIAGLVVEGVIALLAAAMAVFFYGRWRTALATPHTIYTPIFQSPDTTALAPTMETRSNASSHQNDDSYQPFAATGRTYQGNNNMAQNDAPAQAPSDSRMLVDLVNPPASVDDGRTPAVRQLPGAPAGLSRNNIQMADGMGGLAPPNYNTVVGRG